MFQLWCPHVFIHAAGIGKKLVWRLCWVRSSKGNSSTAEETLYHLQRNHFNRSASRTEPERSSVSEKIMVTEILSGLLWYLTHSAVELFTPKTNLKFAQHYRICRKYCRSLNCSFKKLLNGTKKSSSFRSSGPLCMWRSSIGAFSRCFQSKWNNIEHRVVLLCYAVKR